ncbi:hypothetical protein ACIRQY_34935 [Streptomyces sp. NPDC101490]|uniref:hypothetical protein n=1 Tax=Streptomyces sp. NPDC101490 TaxID=3366143 RepID=UPI0037FDBFD6
MNVTGGRGTGTGNTGRVTVGTDFGGPPGFGELLDDICAYRGPGITYLNCPYGT